MARWRLLLLPGLFALAALGALTVHLFRYHRLGSLLYGLLYTAGLPLVGAASELIRWLGSENSGWTWPLAIPVGLLPYLIADVLVQRLPGRGR